MDTYINASYQASKDITDAYSTSFGRSIRLFAVSLRPHIYAIYGLVRIADEIVDTYDGKDKAKLLDDLEAHTYAALVSNYSTNPIVQAFVTTANQYDIDQRLIEPFFKSMRMDLAPKKFTQKLYETYIYGSAEVVGLMCLKVFTADDSLYRLLEPGAKRLGAAYQKVNFLRDIAADAKVLGRWYFPIASFDTFNESVKQSIVEDIEADFFAAASAIAQLPTSSRKAVELSYHYYSELLKQIKQTSASELKRQRIRVGDLKKTGLLVRTVIGKSRV